MYVKIFTSILDSSLAETPWLRSLFMDLLLLADRDGFVNMTNKAIAHRLRRPVTEVDKGVKALMEPDPDSTHTDEDGRRLVPIDEANGFRIVNYKLYRDRKSDAEKRIENAERQRKHREKMKIAGVPKVTGAGYKPPRKKRAGMSAAEWVAAKLEKEGKKAEAEELLAKAAALRSAPYAERSAPAAERSAVDAERNGSEEPPVERVEAPAGLGFVDGPLAGDDLEEAIEETREEYQP